MYYRWVNQNSNHEKNRQLTQMGRISRSSHFFSRQYQPRGGPEKSLNFERGFLGFLTCARECISSLHPAITLHRIDVATRFFHQMKVETFIFHMVPITQKWSMPTSVGKWHVATHIMISRMTIHCDSVAAQSSFSRSKLYLSVNYFQEMDLHSVPANPWEHACTLSPDWVQFIVCILASQYWLHRSPWVLCTWLHFLLL